MTAPRVFRWCDPEPGPEITHVRDPDGDVWTRAPGGWSCTANGGVAVGDVAADWYALLGFVDCGAGLVDCTTERTPGADGIDLPDA